jgi:WD40 repeat protein/serine/threonine protein kinase
MSGELDNSSVSSTEAIFTTALDLSPSERLAYLAGACGEDQHLRQRVEALLRAHNAPEGFLPEQPGTAFAHPALPASLIEQPGDAIGQYKLREKIGEGGCGVVYMAEQEQPLRRKVALKIIKLGMDTKQVVGRFEAERQALALMDHPNIAKILDAGVTETSHQVADHSLPIGQSEVRCVLSAGRPYFVMELVGGIKITEYCDQNQLTTRQRLGLFIQVCHAIQHAHQKGVIHRDIKPSNILVATHDGTAVPKVIDFGIAKATQGRLTDQTVFTAFEQFLGTPAYMSPEQAQLGALDVDTRSDIYSLGVLLYELLTGRTPFDTQEMLAGGLDEIRRTIQEKEPARPSTRLSTMEVGELKNAAERRMSEAARLLHIVRGDLDWIAMKCLEKDRARRYETASGLASDVQRFLNNEPVRARPPSKLYEFQKTVRRHKFGFTATAAVIAALSCGIVATSLQLVRARRAEALQGEERSRAEVATRQAQTALTRMEGIEIRRAEDRYEAGDRRGMLAQLALVLRYNPSNHLAAERLFSTLTHRNWARLACPPLMHSNRVTSAMFSGDGRWVVTSAADNTASVWDTNTGERVAGPLLHDAEINTAEFSPDGRLVVTASDDNTVRVWDARTGQPITGYIRHPARVEMARFSPDGQNIVTLCDDRAARLFDARSAKSISQELRHGDGPPEAHYFIECDFSADGTLLATATGEQGIVRIWNCHTGKPANKLQHAEAKISCVRFSPDGGRVATASYAGSVLIWNLASSPPSAVSLYHSKTVKSVEFSPEGKRIVTASHDGTAQVWEVSSGRPIGPPLRHGDMVRSAVFSPEGLRIVTTSADQTIRVWDAESGIALTEPISVENGAFFAQFHPDGQRLLSAANGSTALVWWVTGIGDLARHDLPYPTCVEFSPDNTKVIVGSDSGLALILEPLTGHAPIRLLGHTDSVPCAVFSADGVYAATGSDDGSARIWDAATGKPVTHPLRIGAAVTLGAVVQFSRDSKRLLTYYSHGVAQIWDVTTGTPASPPLAEGDEVCTAQISPDGAWVATGGSNHTARLWDGLTGKPVSAVLRHEGPVLGVQFSPDSKRLLTASADKRARVWSVPGGKLLAVSGFHSLSLYQARFSPDGSRFVTAMPDRPSVRIWDSTDARPLIEVFAGTADMAQFSADGRRIVTGWFQGRGQLWSAEKGERLSEAVPENGQIMTRLSSDGNLLAASSKDGRIHFWDVTPPPMPVPSWLPELAEALAGRRFNDEGRIEPVLPLELWAVQESMRAWTSRRKSDDTYSRWARWFLSQPNSRPVLPGASLTLAQHAQVLAERQVTPAAAREALLLQPTNIAAMVACGRTLTNAALGDWLTKRAVQKP